MARQRCTEPCWDVGLEKRISGCKSGILYVVSRSRFAGVYMVGIRKKQSGRLCEPCAKVNELVSITIHHISFVMS